MKFSFGSLSVGQILLSKTGSSLAIFNRSDGRNGKPNCKSARTLQDSLACSKDATTPTDPTPLRRLFHRSPDLRQWTFYNCQMLCLAKKMSIKLETLMQDWSVNRILMHVCTSGMNIFALWSTARPGMCSENYKESSKSYFQVLIMRWIHPLKAGSALAVVLNKWTYFCL